MSSLRCDPGALGRRPRGRCGSSQKPGAAIWASSSSSRCSARAGSKVITNPVQLGPELLDRPASAPRAVRGSSPGLGYEPGAVAALVLLARAARARVVAAQLVLVVDAPLLHRRRGRATSPSTGRGVVVDAVGAGEPAAAGSCQRVRLRRAGSVRLPRRPSPDGRRQGLACRRRRAGSTSTSTCIRIADDLLHAPGVHLLEHRLALDAVLDQRILLGHSRAGRCPGAGSPCCRGARASGCRAPAA